MITAENIKSIFNYNEDTGVISWRISPTSSRSIGDDAGCIDSYGYRVITYKTKPYKAHRLAWLYVHGEWPNKVDHVNHEKDDNRISNLRDVDDLLNQQNRSLAKNNTSGVTGVFFYKKIDKWRATIDVCGKKKYLGSFDTLEEAVSIRRKAEINYGFHENHGR